MNIPGSAPGRMVSWLTGYLFRYCSRVLMAQCLSDCSERIVSHSEVIQFDGLSAFRPYCRDVVVFFTSTRWALYIQMERRAPRRVEVAVAKADPP